MRSEQFPSLPGCELTDDEKFLKAPNFLQSKKHAESRAFEVTLFPQFDPLHRNLHTSIADQILQLTLVENYHVAATKFENLPNRHE